MGGVYRYDGTFAGLLTLLARVVPNRVMPDVITASSLPQHDLFSEAAESETDPEQAEEFWNRLTNRLASSCLNMIRLVFLADHPEREMMICRYLLLAWQAGKNVGGMLAHPHVAPVWKLARQVGGEAHRYKGFVRFQEVQGGIYYAALSPDHRILQLIAPHFAGRFADQRWVIHDVRHGEGIVFDCSRRDWLLLPLALDGSPELTSAEERFQVLWQSYFRALAIAERENIGLQQSRVPLKVRPWLVEFANGGEKGGNSALPVRKAFLGAGSA